MKKSERNLMLVTGACMLLALAVSFMPSSDETSAEDGGLFNFGGASSGELEDAKAQYQKYVQALTDKDELTARYQTIAQAQGEAEGGTGSQVKDPGAVFQNQLDQLLRDRLQVASPQIGRPDPSPIPNVDDYYYINIKVTTQGSYADMINLMKNMQQMGLLIQEFQMRPQRGSEGPEAIELNVTVARLVKHDENSKKLLSKRRYK